MRLSYSDPAFPSKLVPPLDILNALDVYQGGSHRPRDLDGQSLAFVGEAYVQLMEERLNEAEIEGAPENEIVYYQKQIERGRRLSRTYF